MAQRNEQRAGIELYYRIKSASKRAIQWFEQKSKDIKKSLGDTASAIQNFGRGSQQVTQSVDQVAKSLGLTNQELAKNVKHALDAGISAERLAGSLGMTTQQVEQLASGMKKADKSTSDFWTSSKRLIRVLGFWLIMGQVYFAILGFQRALAETAKTMYSGTKEGRELEEALLKLRAALVLGVLGGDDFRETLERIAGVVDDLADGFIEGSAAIRGFIKLWRELQQLEAEREVGEPATPGAYPALAPGRWAGGGTLPENIAEAAKIAWREYENALQNMNDEAERYSSDESSRGKKELEMHKSIWAAEEQALQSRLDAWKQFYRDREDAAIDYQRRLEDIETDYQDKVEDINIDYQRRLEDIEREGARKRAQIARESNNQRQKYIDQHNLRVWDATWQHNQNMLRIEQQYQQRLRSIQQQYSETMFEAVGERNATMALKAERTRKAQIKEAELRRKEDRKNEETDYDHRIDLLEKQLALRLKYLEENRKEDLRQLKENMEAQRREAEIQRDRQMEDAERDRRRQRRDEQLDYNRRIRDLDRFLTRKMQDIAQEYAYEVRIANLTFQVWQNYYTDRERAYALHLARMREIERQYSSGSSGTYAPWKPKPPDDPYHWQHGGAMITNRPQSITVGEGGRPELVQVIPLSGTQQHSVNFAGIEAQVVARVEQSIAGFEGRMQAGFSSLARELFG